MDGWLGGWRTGVAGRCGGGDDVGGSGRGTELTTGADRARCPSAAGKRSWGNSPCN